MQMGFAGYFLIVADFINWAKTQRRAGRARAAARARARWSPTALGITDLDPLRYDLLFERFLNPERVSMPDFDIDFCQDGRDRVIEYVKQKYGADSVSQIATFGTMAAKAVVRDVGRVLDLRLQLLRPAREADPVPARQAHHARRRARDGAAAEGAREERGGSRASCSRSREKLEGLTRNVGMHAGGVLIAPGKLTDFCPLYIAEGSDAAVSQFDKDDVEAVGPGQVRLPRPHHAHHPRLDACATCKRLDPTSTLTLEELPLDDAAAYQHVLERATRPPCSSSNRAACATC